MSRYEVNAKHGLCKTSSFGDYQEQETTRSGETAQDFPILTYAGEVLYLSEVNDTSYSPITASKK